MSTSIMPLYDYWYKGGDYKKTTICYLKAKKRDALASLLVKTFIYLKIPKLLIGNTAIRYCY